MLLSDILLNNYKRSDSHCFASLSVLSLFTPIIKFLIHRTADDVGREGYQRRRENKKEKKNQTANDTWTPWDSDNKEAEKVEVKIQERFWEMPMTADKGITTDIK